MKNQNPIAPLATLLLFLSLCCAVSAQPFLVVSNPSPTVQLVWSPVPGATFYNLYMGGVSRGYTNMLSVGNVTNTTVAIPQRGVPYFFAVTVVVSNLQSQFSNEATYTAPNPPAAPLMGPITVLTVMKSSKPDGVFADTGMHWSDTPNQAQAYYKLKIDNAGLLAATTPPLVSPMVRSQPPMPTR